MQQRTEVKLHNEKNNCAESKVNEKKKTQQKQIHMHEVYIKHKQIYTHWVVGCGSFIRIVKQKPGKKTSTAMKANSNGKDQKKLYGFK